MSGRAVGTTSELEQFAQESVTGAAFSAPPRRSSPAMIVWLLAAVACIEAPLAALWLRDAWLAGPTATEGRLRVETQPAGIEVRVDGQVRGSTPVALALSAGAHTVDVRQGDGWRSLPVTIAAGADLTHYLEVSGAASVSAGTTGSLQVTTDPPRVMVIVDGVERGRSPVTVPDLAAGEHQITLQLPNETQRRTVRIERGTTASLIVTGAASSPARSGWLSFNTRVPLQIFEGDRLIGTSEVDRLMVPVGRHDLDFGSDVLGFRARRTVNVQDGEVTMVNLDLPSAPLHINAQPWAEVWVDGESVGQTPIGNLSRPIGPHEIVFRHPQFGERRTTVVVTLKEPARIAVDLRRP